MTRDTCGAQIGGLVVAPGANWRRGLPDRAGPRLRLQVRRTKQGDPSALIRSGRIMLEYMGWDEAPDALLDDLATTIGQKRVTYDFERNLEDAELLSTSEFGQAVVENMG